MYFANPWGLLGLLTLPLIAFIHLYQRRFPRLEIAGLHLWLSEDQVKTAGQRRDRLPITRTLLLELLIALLVTGLLAKPQLSGSTKTTHWVFVLDNSASMMGKDGGQTFRKRAIEEMEARLDETGRNSKVSVILTGTRPVMLAGPAISWTEAAEALVGWQPETPKHRFQAGWDMAAQLAEGSGKTVFLTDRVEEYAGMETAMEFVSVGQAIPNAAFETTRWTIDGETLKASIYMRIRNHSDRTLSCKVVGRVNSQVLFEKPVELAARASMPMSLQLPSGIKELELTIEGTDDRLATDSRVRLVEPGLRQLKVALLLPEDHPGTEAFKKFIANSHRTTTSDKQQANLVIMPFTKDMDMSDSGLPPDTWLLQVGPIDLSKQAREKAESTVGPFLLDRRNPLLEGISLQGAIWAGYQTTAVPVVPIITVGQKPLLGQRSDCIQPCYLLNVDLQQSNLVDSPDFPILMSNFVEQCREAMPGLRRWNYQLNEIVRMKVDPLLVDLDSSARLRLIHEESERSIVRSETVELPPLTKTGVYELFDGESSIGKFAVNFFDNKESDLSNLKTGEVEPAKQPKLAYESAESAKWIGMWLIALAMAAALWNWSGLRENPREAAAR